jgi:hypothetical protein
VREDRIYHVSFESGAAGGWYVKVIGGRKVLGPYETSDEASARGDEKARASAVSSGFGRLVVLDAAGGHVAARDYGRDPRNPGVALTSTDPS